MSPGVSASADVGNRTDTVWDAPAERSTRANPTRIPLVGVRIPPVLTGRCTYTGTTSTPSLLPVLATVNRAVTVTAPLGPLTARPLVVNVVYERPKPNRYRGL